MMDGWWKIVREVGDEGMEIWKDVVRRGEIGGLMGMENGYMHGYGGEESYYNGWVKRRKWVCEDLEREVGLKMGLKGTWCRGNGLNEYLKKNENSWEVWRMTQG